MLSAMHCVVTAGPTYEPLDQVRRLTNFSSGRLGSELTNFLQERGHRVTLLIGQQATWRGERRAAEVFTFGTRDELRTRLATVAHEPVDAVFHAAAVSDFAIGKTYFPQNGKLTEVQAGKFSSRAGPLLVELLPTAKIIRELRGWFPKACLTGWKYEVDGDRFSTLAKAEEQLKDCNTDACVANGPGYGAGFGLVTTRGRCEHLATMRDLFRALAAQIESG